MTNSDKYSEMLAKIDIKNRKEAAEFRNMFVKDINSSTNKELHFTVEEMCSRYDGVEHMKYFLSFNFLLRGAIRTFNSVLRRALALKMACRDLYFVQREIIGQIGAQISLYKKKAQKYNSSDVLDEINLLVELSLALYGHDAHYECFQLLEEVSDLIMLIGKFPLRKNTVAYFSMLYNMFISRGELFFAMNALYRLLGIEKKTNLDEEYVKELASLSILKGNNEEFSHMFGGLSCITDKQFLQELRSIEYGQTMDIELKRESLDKFVFFKNNIGKTFECEDEMVEFIPFLKFNNFSYLLSDGILSFNGTYNRKSNSAKVFDIAKEMAQKKEVVDVRKEEENRIRQNMERERQIKKKIVPVIKKEEKKVPEQKKVVIPDNFTKNFNLFRVYLLRTIVSDNLQSLKMRQNEVNRIFKEKAEKKEKMKEMYMQRKDEINNLMKEYDEKKEQPQRPVSPKEMPAATTPAKGSWRTMPKEPTKEDGIYRPAVRMDSSASDNIYRPPSFSLSSKSYDPSKIMQRAKTEKDETVTPRRQMDRTEPIRTRSFSRQTDDAASPRRQMDRTEPIRTRSFSRQTDDAASPRRQMDKTEPFRTRSFNRQADDAASPRRQMDKTEPIRTRSFNRQADEAENTNIYKYRPRSHVSPRAVNEHDGHKTEEESKVDDKQIKKAGWRTIRR